MIKITKSEEPECLTLLKNEGYTDYKSDLQGDCKDIVRNLLNSDQNGLCAYCQQSFKSKISAEATVLRKNPKPPIHIEHYKAQSSGSGKLDYSNFLGVCSGRYYLDKKKGIAIDHCDTSRRNHPLTINPESQVHIDTIYYDIDDKICSFNAVFQKELNEVLNLNFDELCLERWDQFEQEKKIIELEAMRIGLSRIETYERAIQSVKNRNPSFTGYLLFRFEALLNYHLAKSNT